MLATIHLTSGKKIKLTEAETDILLQITKGGAHIPKDSTTRFHDGSIPTLTLQANAVSHVTYRRHWWNRTR